MKQGLSLEDDMNRLVDEMRNEPMPDIDWDRMEARLDAKLDASASQVASRGRWLRTGFAAVAAVAVLSVGLRSLYQRDEGSTAAVAPQVESGVLDTSKLAWAPGYEGKARAARQLSAGDVIESVGAELAFAESGLVVWTLAAHSRARVLADVGGGHHRIALLEGQVRAEVVPVDPARGIVESFAVDVERTRVAVHGTEFVVEKRAGELVVTVEHGTVTVGSAATEGTTAGHLLVGPAKGVFSDDGARSATMLPYGEQADATPPSKEVVDSTAPTTEESAAARKVASSRINSGPARSAVVAQDMKSTPEPKTSPAITVETLRAGLSRCFDKTYEHGSGEVALSVETTLHVGVREDGTIESARLSPPLKPAFQACAGSVIVGKFASGPQKLAVKLQFGK